VSEETHVGKSHSSFV